MVVHRHVQRSEHSELPVAPFLSLLLFSLSDSLQPHGLWHPRLLHHLELAQTHRSELKSIESVMPSNHLILCCLLLLLPSIFPNIRVFSNELAIRIRWPKYWSFSFSISPSNEYSWLISFRVDRFDFFAVQGILKSLLQHYNSKASVLRRSVKSVVLPVVMYRCESWTIFWMPKNWYLQWDR